jgi:mannose-6-phosphate isomerase
MTVEFARADAVKKPWGRSDLLPWSPLDTQGDKIGELWFHRNDLSQPNSSLMLKLLFTDEPLSIQVHPTDAFARSIGLSNGKSEAWYVLAAAPDARVAVGLSKQLTSTELRAAVEDGTIADLVAWRPVVEGDTIMVPAGTIHAIGAGLVLAEIQQRSDTTFRLFDQGRARELHTQEAIQVAEAGPAPDGVGPSPNGVGRTLLTTDSHFILERLDLAANSRWRLHAEREVWLLILEGYAKVNSMKIGAAEVMFLDSDSATFQVGTDGLVALVAYNGPTPNPELLKAFDGPRVDAQEFSPKFYQ